MRTSIPLPIPAMFRKHALLQELVGEMQIVSDAGAQQLVDALTDLAEGKRRERSIIDVSRHEARVAAINRELNLIERLNPVPERNAEPDPSIPPWNIDGLISPSILSNSP